jgi:hypothetical protein
MSSFEGILGRGLLSVDDMPWYIARVSSFAFFRGAIVTELLEINTTFENVNNNIPSDNSSAARGALGSNLV